MIRRVVGSAFVLIWSLLAYSQISHTDSQIILNLAPEISSESVDIKYYLEGPFGEYGNFVRTQSNVHAYEIPASHAGTAAVSAKMIIYIPGCRFQVFQIPLAESTKTEKTIVCNEPAKTSLSGKVVSDRQLPRKSSEVVVTYEANWACAFLALSDCVVPHFVLATAPLKEDGTFEVRISDYSQDPVVSDGSFEAVMADFSTDVDVRNLLRGGSLSVRLRDAKTWNLIGSLTPPKEFKTAGNDLKTTSFYPVPTEFRISPEVRLQEIVKH